MLQVDLGPLKLDNPIMAASGTFGYGTEMAEFFDLRIPGAVVVKTVTLHPRAGNPPPRMVEVAGGILNSIGLPNGGVEHFAADVLPSVRGKTACLIVNIAGETWEQFGAVAARLDREPGIDALELNLSCPNVAGGGFAFAKDTALTSRIVKDVKQRTRLPVIVKLSPNVTDVAEIAAAAEQAGADCLSLVNTVLGMAIDWRQRRPVLGGVHGGLSGPPLKPIALYQLYQVACAVRLPLIGIGGIETADDVLEFIAAGATAVQVGTATFRDPGVIPRLIAEVEARLVEAQLSHVRELRGAALPATARARSGGVSACGLMPSG